MGSLFYRMMFRNNMDYQEYTFPLGDIMTGSGDTTPTYSSNNPWLNNELTAISNCVGGIANANASTTTPIPSSTSSTMGTI